MLTLWVSRAGGSAFVGVSSSLGVGFGPGARHRRLPLRVAQSVRRWRAALSTAASPPSGPESPHGGPSAAPIVAQESGATYKHTIYSVRRPVDGAKAAFHVESIHEGELTSWSTAAGSGSGSASGSISTSMQPTVEAAPPASAARQAAQQAWNVLWDMFMPKDAHHSVTKDYFPYAKWFFFGSIVSSASGVLSMQSLLYAIGLGAGSIPTAAAVNWVLKDGVGQFGGVIFASFVNNRYDADPKRWRFASAAALEISVLVEILTPLFPAYFLPMASLANVAKNISWLSTSATRASFHNSFALKENLADITAKAGSQAIASSIIGTGLGIAISQFTGPSTVNVLAAFGVLSTVNLFSIYHLLNGVWLRTLNCQRLHLLTSRYLESEHRDLPSLQEINGREKFISVLFSGYKSVFTESYIRSDATLDQLAHGSPHELLRLKAFFADESYLLNMERDGSQWRIDVALEETAKTHDALFAHVHAVILQTVLERDPIGAAADAWSVVEKAYLESLQIRSDFLDKLKQSEWTTDTLLVEERSSRYKWLD